MATAIVSATLALGACSNSDEMEAVDITKPIQMNIGVGGVTQTRVAIVQPTDFETGDAIGIYLATANKSDASSEATAVPAAIGDGKAVNNVKFTKTGTGTGWEGVIYWQNTSQLHTLYGYYPYDENLTGESTTKSVTVARDQDNNSGKGYKDADYLWAKNTPVLASTSAQPMELQHKMSRILIKLTAGNDLSQAELEELAPSLKIVNKDNSGNGMTPLNGTFDIKDGSISISSTSEKAGEITPYRVDGTVSGDTDKEYTYYAILLPGTSFTKNADFVKLTATDETTYLYKLGTSSELTLVAGSEYVFTLKANKTGISLGNFTIKAWTSGDSASGGADMVVPEVNP